jgi:hypothetical protein
MNYLRDVDLPWLALDAAGRLAVFTTAGEGPVPASALRVLNSAEAVLARLSVVGRHELLIEYPRPDDFIAFAERGLYAYDWTDAHRVSSDCTRCYELVARPLRPISIAELSPELRSPFKATVIAGASFGDPRDSIGERAAHLNR